MEQKEPSMEEILSSIRRILSAEEGTLSADEELKSSVSDQVFVDAPMAEDSGKIMDLTQDMLVDAENKESSSAVPDDMVLLSEATVQASTDKLNALTQALKEPKITSEREKVESGDLERLVSALLRPYLKEWLTENLPTLVEKVVQKEVEKLVSKVHQE